MWSDVDDLIGLGMNPAMARKVGAVYQRVSIENEGEGGTYNCRGIDGLFIVEAISTPGHTNIHLPTDANVGDRYMIIAIGGNISIHMDNSMSGINPVATDHGTLKLFQFARDADGSLGWTVMHTVP